MGKPSLLDKPGSEGWGTIESMLKRNQSSLEKLRQAPHYTVILPDPDRASTYEIVVLHEDKKVDCCPEAFSKALEQCEDIFWELWTPPTIWTLRSLKMRPVQRPLD